MSYSTVARTFVPCPCSRQLVRLLIPITATLNLDDSTQIYSAGDVVSGTVVITHSRSFLALGVLIVLDGTIKAVVKDSRGRQWKEAATNLHIFTHAVKAKNRIGNGMVFHAGSHIHAFDFKIPYANLPGTYSSQYGSIKYSISVHLEGAGHYAFLTKQPIQLNSYFNLENFSIEKLAQQSWQTKELQPSTLFTIGKSVKVKSSLQESLLQITKRSVNMKIVLRISKTCFIAGEDIPFEIRNADMTRNGNGTNVELSLLFRTIYTVMGSTVIIKKLTSQSKFLSRDIWTGTISIPEDLRMVSTLSALTQPIIFQYLLRLDVGEEGSSMCTGELPIVLGTIRDPTCPRPKKLILDLEQCKYPVGISDMNYPEDWDKMYKTGRIGYFETKGCMDVGIDERNTSGIGERRMSSLSIASLVTLASTTSSSASTMCPSYSALSSRRASRETLPPTYQEIFEEDEETED